MVDNKAYTGGWKSPRLRTSRPFGKSADPKPRPANPIFDGPTRIERKRHLVGPLVLESCTGVISLEEGESAWFVVTPGGLFMRVCPDCGTWSRNGRPCEHELDTEDGDEVVELGA